MMTVSEKVIFMKVSPIGVSQPIASNIDRYCYFDNCILKRNPYKKITKRIND